ncbi:hypothetical protein GGF32_001715 [Allomyces javanicus]|nr:hypothetical protein GGF32_001715 [Allomyces javanicus]
MSGYEDDLQPLWETDKEQNLIYDVQRYRAESDYPAPTHEGIDKYGRVCFVDPPCAWREVPLLDENQFVFMVEYSLVRVFKIMAWIWDRAATWYWAPFGDFAVCGEYMAWIH